MEINTKREKFWLQDIQVLFTPDKILDFFPSKEQSKILKLNSVARLSLYLGLILTIYRKSPIYLFIILIGLGITIIYNNNSTETLTNTSTVLTDQYTVPTLANPYMNFTMADYLNVDSEGRIKDKKPIANPMNPVVQNEIITNYNAGSKRDVNDMFDACNGKWNFYTVPMAGSPCDREEFANWLYKPKSNCKEDNDCMIYSDLRQNKRMYPGKGVKELKLGEIH